MTDERYRGDRARDEGAHPRRRHLPGRPVAPACPSPRRRGGFPIYRRLRVSNPAPYMFFVRMLGLELAGSSPEPLVRVEGRTVTTRPIAGTRPRGETELRDRLLEHELLADPKERAEHAMLVDLARNDLGRVCTPGSVRPTELMVVERFSKVMHIVSTVEGELAEDMHPLDALAVTFPAGTVTGRAEAPGDGDHRRARADGSRPVRRGGRLLHVRRRPRLLHHDPHGGRRRRRMAHVQTGAGVVADSDPEAELQETKSKAAALLPAVLEGGVDDDPRRRPLRLFTYNLVQLVESLGHETQVVKSDAEPADALVARNPAAVILSPGPGRPEDAGVFMDLLGLLPGRDADARRVPRPPGDGAGRRRPRRARGARPRQVEPRVPRGQAGSSTDCRTRSRRGATTRSSSCAKACPRSSSSPRGARTGS